MLRDTDEGMPLALLVIASHLLPSTSNFLPLASCLLVCWRVGLNLWEQDERRARKLEDFEKLKEVSAHMDHVVKLLNLFFPREEGHEAWTSSPRRGRLQISPRPALGAPATTARVDRAVSARRLTTDRAVSVASGAHLSDQISGGAIR